MSQQPMGVPKMPRTEYRATATLGAAGPGVLQPLPQPYRMGPYPMGLAGQPIARF